jgi:hypothetical protein
VLAALAFALFFSAVPPWATSCPKPAVVWQAASNGAAPSKVANVTASRNDLDILVSLIRGNYVEIGAIHFNS